MNKQTEEKMNVLKNGCFFQDKYDEQFVKEVYSAPLQTYDQQMKNIRHPPNKVVRIQYEGAKQYKTLATLLRAVPDLKVCNINILVWSTDTTTTCIDINKKFHALRELIHSPCAVAWHKPLGPTGWGATV